MEKGLPLTYSSTHFSFSSFPHFYRVLVLHRKCVWCCFTSGKRVCDAPATWKLSPSRPSRVWVTSPCSSSVGAGVPSGLTAQWPCTASRSTQQHISKAWGQGASSHSTGEKAVAPGAWHAYEHARAGVNLGIFKSWPPHFVRHNLPSSRTPEMYNNIWQGNIPFFFLTFSRLLPIGSW